jgi:hypothetical protein
LAFGQSATTTYTADYANGGFTPSTSSVSSDHTQTQVNPSLNGALVPLEQRQERVISKAADGTVTTETIVRRNDPTGQFTATERTITESRKTPGGGSIITATVYRTDIDGQEQRAERKVVETQVAGATTSINTVVERPSLDGSFQTAEKRSAVMNVAESPAAQKTTTTTTNESVYRADPNGGFVEAERKVTTETQSSKETVVNTTTYQPDGIVGALQFQEQRVATSSTAPDGSTITRVDVYAPSADGTVQESGAPLQLKQERIISHEKAADGSFVEVLSVREPTVSDARHLGDPRVISKTVCTGKCDTPPVTPEAAAPAAPVPAKP